MKTLHVDDRELPLDFERALKLAETLANTLLGEAMLLSWFDRERGIESPAHASECHIGCDTPGYWDFALHRGAQLAVNIGGGRFVFCFLPLGELRLD